MPFYLQAALAGARGLHVGLIIIILADSAFYQDATRCPALFNSGIITRSHCGRRRIGGLINGRLKSRLREQSARHYHEMVRHLWKDKNEIKTGISSFQAKGIRERTIT
jgi:hypothetical protein